MANTIYTLEKIRAIVKPIADKYNVQSIYLFGSYARGEANENSDLDFLVFGGDNFKLTNIFALAEELRVAFQIPVDVFEINEINTDSSFYSNIMNERLNVAWSILINSVFGKYMNTQKNLYDFNPTIVLIHDGGINFSTKSRRNNPF